MADLIKKIKIKKQDGTFTDYIPIGAEAQNISTSDGDSVQSKLNKKPYYYNNITDMKADTKLKVGDYICTLGYYEANDGGAGNYVIVNGNFTDDGGSYHKISNNLYAKLIIKNSTLDVKQWGAKGDNETDDYNSFNKIFQYIAKNPLYIGTGGNRNWKYNINIPLGLYKIKQPNLFAGTKIHDHSSPLELRLKDAKIDGNCSTLIFEGFSGPCFYNEDKFLFVEWNNINFKVEKDDGVKNKTLFLSLGYGGPQSFTFNNCTFIIDGIYGCYLQGNKCNSEWIFNDCNMRGDYDSFLYTENETGSDDFVNYWFFHCRVWTPHPFINMSKGGHIILDTCDFSGLDATEDFYLFTIGDQEHSGQVAYGVATFIDNNSRYELKTSHAKVIRAYWQQAQILFNNSDFSSSAHLYTTAPENVFCFYGYATPMIVRFCNCKILGKIYTYNNLDCVEKVWLDNCIFFKIDKFSDEYVLEKLRADNDYYNLKFTNARIYGNKSAIGNFTTNQNQSLLNENFVKYDNHVSLIYYDKPAINASSWKHEIYSPAFIKNIKVIPFNYNNNNRTTSFVLYTKYATVKAINNNIITIDSTETNRFKIGDVVLIQDSQYTITGINFSNNTLTLDNNLKSTVTIEENIYYIILQDSFMNNASATIKEKNDVFLVYNDILLSCTYSSGPQFLIGNIIIESYA